MGGTVVAAAQMRGIPAQTPTTAEPSLPETRIRGTAITGGYTPEMLVVM